LSAKQLREHRRKCGVRVARSCGVLARHYGGSGTQRTLIRAVALYRLACALGSDQACFESRAHQSSSASSAEVAFAHRTLVGDALRGGARLAEIRKLVLHCVGGDGASCAKAARLFRSGTGVRASEPRARQLSRLACVQDHRGACKELTEEHSDALGEKVGRQRLARACKKGGLRDCYRLAGRLASGADGLPKRPKRAHALLVKACEGGIDGACYDLAIAYGYGNKAVKVDTKKYVKFLIRACKLRSTDACRELHTPNAQLRKACREQGIAAACVLLKTRR
jgi:TPR repeat protein